MGEGPGIEVDAHHMIARDVFIVVNGISETKSRAQQILEIRVTVEQPRALSKLIVQPAHQIVFAERSAETSRIDVKRRRDGDGGLCILLRPLAVAEKEQLILDDRPA